ncbi:MAG: helix-turn-helix transcriptional regulator [Bdellovibrionales bacterium]|nr:helix-turn-helix transcriptional regulator [Bdellovibrionales bacterium]
MKRGRPKGRSTDDRSFGPLADLIRSARLRRGLGLLDVAKACQCSVQFISNIEHGRAPLPWEKAPRLARVLGLPVEELQAANLSVRADFQGFVSKGKSAETAPAVHAAELLVRLRSSDDELRDLLSRYASAPESAKKRFLSSARRILAGEADAQARS